jgi:transposase-like protein
VLEAELTSALGSARHERTERREGYRHGALQRTITTGDGLRELEVPRGRIRQEDGTTKEFRSQLLPRYARRTRDVDAAILGSYLAGTNSRRIRTALKPLLGERHLSKSAVSRIVARLRGCLPHEAAALTLLYGLVAFGQIVLRRIDGREQLLAFLAKEWFQAA